MSWRDQTSGNLPKHLIAGACRKRLSETGSMVFPAIGSSRRSEVATLVRLRRPYTARSRSSEFARTGNGKSPKDSAPCLWHS